MPIHPTRRERIQRDLHPTPAARFAMRHWHDRYAASGLGSMGFFDSLTPQEQRYAEESAQAICDSQKVSR